MKRPALADAHCALPQGCQQECALSTCAAGGHALVVRVECSHHDACRLRALGVYEGARVRIVDTRHGLILDVRGSRLALGRSLARLISVLPLAA
ncbi:MAG TPA: FeoA family protein [Gemmatimonadaceae bacterium]|nr:FeoA family protein [Gemmatimonadaceae bacterium]